MDEIVTSDSVVQEIKAPSHEADRGLSSIVFYAMQVSQQCKQCTYYVNTHPLLLILTKHRRL